MERYKCRFCFKKFVNGRSLGGHMRSHISNLHYNKFNAAEKDEEEEEELPSQLSDETESYPSSSSSSSEKDGFNGFIKKPKMKNQDFTFTNSLLLQDNSSETEFNQRFKKTRKLDSFQTTSYKTESSVSDTTTEEDLAFCLMMLSRDDKWKRKKKIKGRFKCETCEKVFKSYQALGGHRASHKKNNNKTEQIVITEDKKIIKKKLHQCPICLRVFSSGQALGGHKRSHGINGGLSLINQIESVNVVNVKMIDLNLPATMEDFQ